MCLLTPEKISAFFFSSNQRPTIFSFSWILAWHLPRLPPEFKMGRMGAGANSRLTPTFAFEMRLHDILAILIPSLNLLIGRGGHILRNFPEGFKIPLLLGIMD